MTEIYDIRAGVRDFLGERPKKLLIDGQWVDAASGESFATPNPATGEDLAYVASGGAEDVDRAVKAARRALEGPWSRITPSERGRLLWRVADLIEEHADDLAQVDTLDNGKPFKMAREDDLPEAVDVFRYYAGWASKIEGETIPVSVDGGNYLNYTMREPVGVVGVIIPWNYPLALASWKLGPALACGNTVVLKPAEQTSLSALWLGNLLQEAGFPDGVVNIITGFGETAGAALTSHAEVDGVTFTGSTEVGRHILESSAKSNLKRVGLELGGKSPNIILSDADVEAAIDGASDAIFYVMGQDCAAGSRLFVESDIYDEVVEGISRRAENITLGNGLDPQTDQGPVVSQEQLDRVMGYLDKGKQEGARTVTGGNRVREGELANGYFVEPTVFADANNQMTISREEIFGPVVSVIPFQGAEDAIIQGNETTYGLGAGIWTRDIKKAHTVARAIKAGAVWINCYNVYDPASPFGGYKQSGGFGRDLGKHALDQFTQTKSVWVDLS